MRLAVQVRAQGRPDRRGRDREVRERPVKIAIIAGLIACERERSSAGCASKMRGPGSMAIMSRGDMTEVSLARGEWSVRRSGPSPGAWAG